MTWLRLRLELYWMVCPNWLNRLPVRALRRIIKIAGLPLFMLRYPWTLKPLMTALPYVEMPLTTRCTLKCVKCSNLMQYYEHPWDLPPDSALQNIDILLDTSDYIFDFGLIGGETFLYPHLSGLILRLCGSRKVGKISLTTNGTLLPKDEGLLCALAHPKVYVKISNYGTHSCRLQELTELFDKRAIKYKVLDMSKAWYDFGDLHFRGRSAAELRCQFRTCASGCRSYVRGQLHYCPRSSHGTDLGLVPDDPLDYADLTDPALNRLQRRLALCRLLERDYITACNYCDKGTPLHVLVPAAEQMAANGGKNNARND